MPARLLLFLSILTLAAGCAQGYYDTRPAYPQPEAAPHWYKNAETEQEYHQRIRWMDYETSHPWLWRR